MGQRWMIGKILKLSINNMGISGQRTWNSKYKT